MPAETTISRTEAEDDLRAVLSVVAHDLRAPAQHVYSFVRLLTDHLSENLGDSGDETVQIYADCLTGAAADISEKLAALTRYGSATAAAGEFVPVDLAVIADEAVAAATESLAAAGLQAAVEGTATTFGDAEVLATMLHELLDNAAKFAVGGSVVTVTVVEEPSRSVVTVVDDGPGVKAAFAPESTRLFRRFHKDLAPGAGVGLAIVERVAKLHGGSVDITTDTDSGFSARIELRLIQGLSTTSETADDGPAVVTAIAS